MPKILITGVAGLIGSHLSRYLLDKGYEVVGVDDFSGGYRDFVDPRVHLEEINLVDQKLTRQLFKRHRPDVVYHFAAYAAEGLSPFIRNFNYTNNLLASTNIVNNCVEFGSRLIFTSSMAVYGAAEVPFHEGQTPEPTDPYGIAKYAVEMDIKQAHDQFGLPFVITRPHNIVGIYQNIWDKYRNVIGIWIRQTLHNEPITIFGDGEQKRAFSDIKYYLEPFEKLITEGDGEIFNLGADQEFKVKTAAEIMVKVGKEFGYEPRIEFLPPRHEVKFAYCDHAKAKDLLDFKDQTNLEQTIREMFVWAEHQPERPVKYMAYELERGMYSFWK